MDRPFISLKLATSLDGKIALANGNSKWITCEASRAIGRKLRAGHDGICIGANTAALDDPKLTTRIDGKSNPVRIVFDSRLRLSPSSILAQTAGETPVMIFCDQDLKTGSNLLKSLGVQVIAVPRSAKGLDLKYCLDVLKQNGISSLLIEGGGTLAASFLKDGLVDRIHWFRAPIILGGDGRNCIADMSFQTLDIAPRFERKSFEWIETDSYEVLERIG